MSSWHCSGPSRTSKEQQIDRQRGYRPYDRRYPVVTNQVLHLIVMNGANLLVNPDLVLAAINTANQIRLAGPVHFQKHKDSYDGRGGQCHWWQ